MRAVVLVAVLLSGCVMGIPDADTGIKPPRKTEPCEVRVTIDRKLSCWSRAHVQRELCKATPQCSPL